MQIEIMTPFLNWIQQKKRYKIAYGGRGGAKSRQASKCAIVLSYLNNNCRIVFAREVEQNIKYSNYQLILSLINDNNLQDDFEYTQYTITNKRTNVEFIFLGLHDYNIEEKIKGIENIALFIVDEAQNLGEKVYRVLGPSIRRPESEIWFIMNPTRFSDSVYKYIQSVNPDFKNYTYNHNEKDYYYKEHIDDDNLILNINFDGNCFFNKELEKERQLCIKYTPHEYNHVWLGALEQKVGKIFKEGSLNFYNYEEKKEVLDSLPTRCIIDPAFGDKSCFHSVMMYKFFDGNVYLIDSGLIRGNDRQTNDEVILDFINQYEPSNILIESNFAQSQLVKKIQRYYSRTKGFISKQNKYQRIIDNSILVNEYVYIPEEWKTPPSISQSEYHLNIQGRGYIFLQQLLNFSDIEKENCIKGNDTSYIDGPDNLCNLLIHDNNYRTVKRKTEYNPAEHDILEALWKKHV